MTTEAQPVVSAAPVLFLANAASPEGRRSRWKMAVAALLERQWLLLAILAIQAGLTLRLSNTAFNDEALYLNIGHAEVAHLLHGAVIPNFDASVSGAPFVYPVLAAAISDLGGLQLLRGLSLVLMLLTTMLVYGFSRRIFGWAAAVVGAATFSFAAPILFIGHLATYDAMTVFLLALGAWLAVLAAQALGRRSSALAFAAGLAAGLGALTKYAGLLYLPTILVAGVLVAVRSVGMRRALVSVGGPFVIGAGGLLIPIAASASQLLVGLRATTTNRQLGAVQSITIVGDTALYVGGMLLLAVAGVLVLARQRAPLQQLLLGTVFAATGFLATIVELRLHTAVSLQKHAGFGLVFAAPMVGVALAGAMAHWRRRMLVPLIAILIALVSLGANTSQSFFNQWPNTGNLLQLLQSRVQDGPHYLVEEAAVPEYYLAGTTNPDQWVSTYFFQYRAPNGSLLSGRPAFERGISNGYFEVVALRLGPTKSIDVSLERAIAASHRYRLIAMLRFTTSYGPGQWRVWQLRT